MFSFSKYVRSKGVDVSTRISLSRRLFIQQYWVEYLERGGFPEVLFVEGSSEESAVVRIKILQERFRSILLCDVME